MSTATILRPSSAPSVRALAEVENQCAADYARAEARLHEVESQSRSADDPLARREARRLLPDAEDAVEVAATSLERARRATEQEANRVRAEIAPTVKAKVAPIVRALNDALAMAAKENAKLADVAREAQELLGFEHAGSVVDTQLIWAELMPETAATGSKLASWRRLARKAGIDVRD